ncbi:hypothetical protein [Kitasatospora phosalacinea]|uniref:hypothetical protein n=1 Tax=Kitasatospora phosalacinea TaxID=2065 RepID=UPI00131CFFB4|nr:hypothetical protein [Kitasatospora phosalacinea]
MPVTVFCGLGGRRAGLVANVTAFFAGGHGTAVNLVGNGVPGLLRHPDRLQALRADPGPVQDGIDELPRHDAPTQLVARISTQGTGTAGATVPAGSTATVRLGAVLAKTGLRLASTELAGRYRDVTPACEDVVRRRQVNTRGLGELRVDLVP